HQELLEKAHFCNLVEPAGAFSPALPRFMDSSAADSLLKSRITMTGGCNNSGNLTMLEGFPPS
ncbi:MAG: hypothetical protein QF745_09400, partial [Planctomycetota bacterium]|nr:hypothetical protein [Planctomycetota bacterium]